VSAKRKYEPADLGPLKTRSLSGRPSLTGIERSARLTKPGSTAAELFESLPDVLAARNLRVFVEAIVEARKAKRPVIMGFGAHVIKCGLSPLVIDLMEREVITALVTNGACAVHDFELAFCGKTSEDVEKTLPDGSFGTAAETAQALNEAALRGETKGYGRALGELILSKGAQHADRSVYAAAVKLGVPATVHVAIGTDVVHMHPDVDGGAVGRATLADFRLLVSVIGDLEGGVYMNFGSAVILPEVFLKALSAARNLGAVVKRFAAADFDMIRHYRPSENIVRRPGGTGYSFIGHHELMLPLLRQAIIDRMAPDKQASRNSP
jgi:hypothetical protein